SFPSPLPVAAISTRKSAAPDTAPNPDHCHHSDPENHPISPAALFPPFQSPQQDSAAPQPTELPPAPVHCPTHAGAAPTKTPAHPPHPHRIQMHITAQDQRPFLRIHHHRFESSLEEMTAAPVPPVEPDAVTDVEPLNGSAQIGLPQFQLQVIMIVHHDKAMQP